ncbi:MAG: hypothetical protein ACXIVQ_15110 [Acidimicrobiales bacterium]
MQVDRIIHCIDCGSDCHLLTPPNEDGEFEPGDRLVYRCEDCLDRWDLLVPDEEAERGDTWEPPGF